MAFSLAPRKRIFDDTSSIRATTSGPRSQFELRVPRQVCRRQGPYSCSALSWRGRRETTLDHLCAPRRREAVAVGPPGEEGCRTLVGSMGKAMGLENLAGFLHPTLSERGGAGEGRGESHRRGERTSRHGAGRSAPPAVPRFRADRRARTPSLPPPEAVAVGQHRRPVACCRRCSWRAPCPAPSAFVAPCRPPPSPSGRPAARRRGWIWPSHGHRRPSAAPTPLTPAPLGGSSKEADLAALPPSPPVRRSRTADLADAALASAGTPPLLRRRFRRSAQRHRHLRRFLCVGERKRGGRGKERKC